jgi:hypothetical protein
MRCAEGDGQQVEDALRGAAHRAAPRRLACLGAVRADFERALADDLDPAIVSAEIASELRRGADYVRVTVAVTVVTTDVAGALAIAWDAFRSAAQDDVAGWEVAAAAAQVQPELPLTEASDHTEWRSGLPVSRPARETQVLSCDWMPQLMAYSSDSCSTLCPQA